MKRFLIITAVVVLAALSWMAYVFYRVISAMGGAHG